MLFAFTALMFLTGYLSGMDILMFRGIIKAFSAALLLSSGLKFLLLIRRGVKPGADLIVIISFISFASAAFWHFQGYSLPGDSFVFLSQAERMAQNHKLGDASPFGVTDDPRYRASFLPLVLSVLPLEERLRFFYKFLPPLMLAMAMITNYVLAAKLTGRITAVSATACFFVFFFVRTGGITEYSVLNLPKAFIPWFLFPAFLYFHLVARRRLQLAVFFLAVFTHLFYGGLLLLLAVTVGGMEFLLKRKSRSLKGGYAGLLACMAGMTALFYAAHGMGDCPVRNPFFLDWTGSTYARFFISSGSLWLLNPWTVLKKAGFALDSGLICAAAYVGCAVTVACRGKRWLVPATLIPLAVVGFNPVAVPLAAKIVTPFKIPALIQCFPFCAGISLFIFMIQKHLPVIMRKIFLSGITACSIALFFYLCLTGPDHSGAVPVISVPFPEILHLKELSGACVLCDEVSSMYLAAFAGSSVWLSPAPFSSPCFDYKSARRQFEEFLEFPGSSNLPEGITHVLLARGLKLDRPFLREVLSEKFCTLYRVVR